MIIERLERLVVFILLFLIDYSLSSVFLLFFSGAKYYGIHDLLKRVCSELFYQKG